MATKRQVGRRTGEDRRGNSKDRAVRKTFLLSAPQFGGNGKTVKCTYCRKQLTYVTVQADRIIPGGSYRRSNITPACGGCNARRGNNRCWGCPVMDCFKATVAA